MGSGEGRRGYLSEIFCSIQGEGLYAGTRQVFVRTAGCSAGCTYCDTPGSLVETVSCRVHTGEPREMRNPVRPSWVRDAVLEITRDQGPVEAVSITGGEPLEQSAFVAGIARLLKEEGFTIHLDTNGLEPAGLEEVLPCVDVIAMDVKLPSALGRARWEETREFLRKARGREVFVKIVVGSSSPGEEVEEAVGMIAGIERSIPLFLQPEAGDLSKGDRAGKTIRLELFRLQSRALRRLDDVRIMPQIHKVLGLK